MSTKGVLFVVDSQNLYYSARELFGKNARIDFLKLRNRIIQTFPDSLVYGVAFAPGEKDGKASLSKVLTHLGYDVVGRDLSSRESFEQSLNSLHALIQSPFYQALIIASGDGAFAPVALQAKNLQKPVLVLTFADALNTELARLADTVIYLDIQVLFGDFEAYPKVTTTAVELDPNKESNEVSTS